MKLYLKVIFIFACLAHLALFAILFAYRFSPEASLGLFVIWLAIFFCLGAGVSEHWAELKKWHDSRGEIKEPPKGDWRG